MGNCPAATVVTQMRNTFKQLRFGLLVGIGGGVPIETEQGPIKLGHVVVSKPVDDHSGAIQYDHGVLEADGRIRRTGFLNAPPSVLLASANMMNVRRNRAREDPLVNHLLRIDLTLPGLRKYKYPGVTQDDLLQLKGLRLEGSQKQSHDEEEAPKRIVVHRGTIASGEKVVKNSSYRDSLAKDWGILCFEMEAAGAMTDFPCLVIRGISDYADASKNYNWQGYASAVAAAYARELFFHMPVDQVKQCSIPERG
jgi:nucleoside phosphorylase